MGKVTIDQALIASRKYKDTTSDFTQRVMNAIKKRNRHSEIFSKLVRRIGTTNQGSLFMKIQRLPKFALVAVVICCGATVTSGVAYAAYQLWLNPSAKVQTIGLNQYGRSEALVTFNNCGTTASASYEVKSGVSLSSQEITQVLQARCELNAIQKWADEDWRSDTPTLAINPSSEAYKVTKIDGSTISVHSTHYDTKLLITKDTQFVVNGMQTSASAIKANYVVSYIERDTYPPSGNGAPIKRELMAIVKLELPIEAYSVDRQNVVSEREGCTGNPEDSCLEEGASIDIYPRGSEDAFVTTTPGDMFDIQGEITAIHGKSFTVKGSSGAIYTITAPFNVIDAFNTNNSKDYDNTIIAVGDNVSVSYSQTTSDDHKVVRPEQLSRVNLLIEMGDTKLDSSKKY